MSIVVKKPIKAALTAIAQREGTSVSEVGEGMLVRGVAAEVRRQKAKASA